MWTSFTLRIGKLSKVTPVEKVTPKLIGVSVRSLPNSYQLPLNSKFPHRERIALLQFNKLIESSRKRKLSIINKAISLALKSSVTSPQSFLLKTYESNKIKAKAELERIQKIVPSYQYPLASAALSLPKPSIQNGSRTPGSLSRQTREAKATADFQKLVQEISMTRKAQIEDILSKLRKDISNEPSKMSNEAPMESIKFDQPLMLENRIEQKEAERDELKERDETNKALADTPQNDIKGEAEPAPKPSKSSIQRGNKLKSEPNPLEKVISNTKRDRRNTPHHASPSKPIDLTTKNDHSDRERVTYFNLLKHQVQERLSNVTPGTAAVSNPGPVVNTKPSSSLLPRNPTGLFRL
ncbi:unnamed protein product [Phytomonas sp. Hart1]|nr:unnamed protein product [Phytomonas sp. Hart1]|eukprot:CCW69371.1 unnamed protein product [Phytomonas sp. isolate Hart1]